MQCYIHIPKPDIHSIICPIERDEARNEGMLQKRHPHEYVAGRHSSLTAAAAAEDRCFESSFSQFPFVPILFCIER